MSKTHVAGAVLVVVSLTGCGVGLEPLMPTPVLYTDLGMSPLDHIPPDQQWKPRRVYFATNRERSKDLQKIDYSNTPSTNVSLGLVLMGFGGPEVTWATLSHVSMQDEREEEVNLTIDGIVEAGHFDPVGTIEEAAGADAAGWILEDLNDSIADARDQDLLIYVHGAKVNFYNGCAFAAQLDHFMGRDMTSMAFAWPTRQNIFAYSFGNDYQRAYDSAESLASLLELLAEHTIARRIHILCWSAGGRVTTRALASLRDRYPDETMEPLRTRLRIGTAYFAAADVPQDEFLAVLPSIHGIVDRVIVTSSSHDEALKTAAVMMGEQPHIGQAVDGRLTEEEEAMIASLDRLEVVNVSFGAEDRGFDITGHRYWFNHPWASTDVVIAIRSDLPPAERGLVQAPDERLLWYMPDDYPARLRSIDLKRLRHDR